MDQAYSIFANGMLGVFAGMMVLYLVMKLIAFCVSREKDEETEK